MKVRASVKKEHPTAKSSDEKVDCTLLIKRILSSNKDKDNS